MCPWHAFLKSFDFPLRFEMKTQNLTFQMHCALGLGDTWVRGHRQLWRQYMVNPWKGSLLQDWPLTLDSTPCLEMKMISFCKRGSTCFISRVHFEFRSKSFYLLLEKQYQSDHSWLDVFWGSVLGNNLAILTEKHQWFMSIFASINYESVFLNEQWN